MTRDAVAEVALLVRKAVHSMSHHQAFQSQLDGMLELPEEDRRGLLEALADRYRRKVDTDPVRVKLLTLIALVGRGLDGLPLEEERAARLEVAARCHSFWYADRYEALAMAEITAGRPSRQRSSPPSGAAPSTATATGISSRSRGSSPSPCSTSARSGRSGPWRTGRGASCSRTR